jgi:SAM-dependent methyltransferase
MNPPGPSDPAEFDAFARDYDAALDRGLSASGEGKAFFLQGRVDYLGRCLRALGLSATGLAILDFGCGTGDACPVLKSAFRATHVLGVDVSRAELQLAEQRRYGAGVSFSSVADFAPQGELDLIYCNGTFHHIPPGDRPGILDLLHRSLKPGGVLALWENNPWNPGTRHVMSRIPFDRDAIPLSVLEARRLVRAASFGILRSDFLFIFPRWLAGLRWLEPGLSKLPLGGQYQVLGRKAPAPQPTC